MKVLVTGGAGYIGSFVCKLMQESGHDLLVVDNLFYGHREAVSAPVAVGDLSDRAFLDSTFTSFQPEAVMHLAAWIEVGESVTNPSKYILNNTGGTASLLQSMADHNVKNLVFSSTAAVYGSPQTLPVTEDSPTIPENPYGLSKLLTETTLPAYQAAYGLRSITLRYFNAAGAALDGSMGEAHEPASHLITNAIRGALGRQTFRLFGDDYPTRDGTCVRDFIHVLDIARAHVLALAQLVSDGRSAIYNVGAGQGLTNLEVIDAIRRISGKEFNVEVAPRRAGDPAVLIADSTRIRSELGWSPGYSDLDTIMRTSWAWEVDHPNGYAVS